LWQREAEELLRAFGRQVGRPPARRAREPLRRRRGHLQPWLRRRDPVRAAGPRLGRGPQLDLEQQPEVRARLRADALQGRRGRRRRSPHREEHPDPTPAFLLMSEPRPFMKSHLLSRAVLAGVLALAGTAQAADPLTLLNVSYDPTRELWRD